MEIALRNESALPLDMDIITCLATGWAWLDLMATPGWVVDDVRTYLAKKSVIDMERSRMLDAKGRR